MANSCSRGDRRIEETDGLPRPFPGSIAVVVGLRVQLRHFVSRGWNGNCEGEYQPRRVS
jgi:hypothetical protein